MAVSTTVNAAVGVAFHIVVGMAAGTAMSRSGAVSTAIDTGVGIQVDTDADEAVAWLSAQQSGLLSKHDRSGGPAIPSPGSIISAVLQIIHTL